MSVAKTKILPTLGEKFQRVLVLGSQSFYQRLLHWFYPYCDRVYWRGMLQHIMECIRYFFKEILLSKKTAKQQGPNNMEELLEQFNYPKKEKTKEDMIRDYQVFLTMCSLELDMLKMSPPIKFYAHNWVEYEGGKAYYDWTPCALRPEVLYSCYGKN